MPAGGEAQVLSPGEKFECVIVSHIVLAYDVHVCVPLLDGESLLELLPRCPDHRRRARDARVTRVGAFKVDRVAQTIPVQPRDLGVKDVSAVVQGVCLGPTWPDARLRFLAL